MLSADKAACGTSTRDLRLILYTILMHQATLDAPAEVIGWE